MMASVQENHSPTPMNSFNNAASSASDYDVNILTSVNSSNNATSSIIDNDARKQKIIKQHEIANTYAVQCEESGFCSSGSSLNSHIYTNAKRSIVGDLKSYRLDDEIINMADVIYNKMFHRVRRGTIRKRLLYYCTYCAFLELKRIPPNPNELGEKFGLSPGEVQKCSSTFSPLQTGYTPPTINTSPLIYLNHYCQKAGLSEDTTLDVADMAEGILEKDPTLLQETPQTVAAGLIHYYMVTHGIMPEDPKLLSTITMRSHVTIDKIYKRVAFVDNS